MTMRPGKHDDELISASLTGDLSEGEQAALDRHLAECARCRETLAAFSEERRLISGMRHVSPPRDLGARVRAGIDRGSSGSLPWWRRRSTIIGLGASLATVATAILALLVIGNLQRGPEVGQVSQTPKPSSSQSSIIDPSVSGEPTVEPQPTATVNPQAFLRPGELGYFSMTGAPQEPLRLSFIKDSTGEAVAAAQAPSGPPVAAAISPDGEWVGYITEGTYTGVNQVWALHLTDGTNVELGCSFPNPFADRLVWSTDNRYLAYTLAAVDAESHASMGCGDVEPGAARSTDAWIFQTDTGEHYPLTTSGDAFAADSAADLEGGTNLLISHAAEEPWSEYVSLPEPLSPKAGPIRFDGAFLPLVSPRGIESVAYWTGTMAQGEDGSWRFSQAGMPVVGSFAANPPDGEPLFQDLSTAGGAGFESGHVAWGQDGDLIAFWGGQWTAAPQGDDYPSALGVYAGRLTDGGLTQTSRLDLPIDADVAKIVSIAFQPDGVRAIVSLGDKTAGTGDPVSANLFLVPIGGGDAVPVGGGIDPPPWDGPAVYGEQPRALRP